MYNKIAPIILNLAKAQGSGAVYVSQPDSEKEKLAGKIFILAEITGKKSESDKFLDFLISELEENYYSDEKILLIGKIEGLTPENIFEAALAKTNKSINEFLRDHKMALDAKATSITLGVIYGAKLHFTSFGRNRALLIYRRQDGYEIINVDSEAKDADTSQTDDRAKKAPKSNNLFSAVLSGDIPLNSYFIFASESLPEYLSSKDLVNIITKLPPIVAAEQIKNTLARINNYVPFLGIIIKNTTDRSGGEIKEVTKAPLSAHNSISSLNHTEEKTENMLSPAGLVNVKKVSKNIKNWLLPKKEKPTNKSPYERSDNNNSHPTFPAQDRIKKTTSLNLPSASSFLRPQKVLLKKGSRHFFTGLKLFILFIPRLFSPSFWKNNTLQLKNWFKTLNKKSLYMFLGLILIIIALVVSITYASINKKNQKIEEGFNLTITEIEEKEALLDSYLLYDNTEGAKRVFSDIKDIVSNLPQEKDYQITKKTEIEGRLSIWEDKILGINRIDAPEELASFPELNLNGLVMANDKLFTNSSDAIYQIDLTNKNNEKLDYSGSLISSGIFNNTGNSTNLYFKDDNKIITLNPQNNTINVNEIANYEDSISYGGLDSFSSRIYLLSPTQNQLFVYNSNLSTRSEWIKEDVDVRNTVDIYIDGDIYFLEKNGAILKFRSGEKQEFAYNPLSPETNNAQKIIGSSDTLYILADNDRLISINKNKEGDNDPGEKITQYLFTNLNISDITITPDNKIYLLSDSKIYTFSP